MKGGWRREGSVRGRERERVGGTGGGVRERERALAGLAAA